MNDELAPCYRIALGIEYDGTDYSGWQSQPHAPSIQDTLNQAISRVANEAVECTGAGRTDSGVHSTGQVAHFDCTAERSPRSWTLGINSNLPADINVLWAAPVSVDFHARFSAVSRSYRFVILNRAVRSALHRNRAWWVRPRLNLARMQEAAAHLVGKHDFSSFRASSCQSHSPIRTVTSLEVSQEGEFVFIECSADAFLHHMVRNLAGSLVRVGSGDASPAWVADILAAKDRKVSGITAPAAGLTLTQVGYPEGLLNRPPVGGQNSGAA